MHDHSGVVGAAHRKPREGRAQVLGERGEQRRVDRAVVGELLAHDALADRDLAAPARPPPASPTRTAWWGQLSIARYSSPPACSAIRSALVGVAAERQQHRGRHVVARGGVGVGGVQPVAERRQALVGLDVERAGGHRRGVLAGAVPEHRVAARHQPAHHRVHGGVGAVSTASTAMSSSISRASVRWRSASENAGRGNTQSLSR